MTAPLIVVLDSPALKGWEQSPGDSSGGSQVSQPAPAAIQKVPMRRFVSSLGTVESAKPIQISLSQGEEGVIAEIESLHLSAVGEDASQAVLELSQQVVHFFYHYDLLRGDQVTGLAARLRQVYTTQFRSQTPRVA